MPEFLIAIHQPDDGYPEVEDPANAHAIDVLNEEMAAAGVRVFVGGLRAPRRAKSLRRTGAAWV